MWILCAGNVSQILARGSATNVWSIWDQCTFSSGISWIYSSWIQANRYKSKIMKSDRVSYCCFYLSSHWPISLQEPCLLSSLACTLSFLFFSFLTVISCMHPLLSSLLSSFCSTLISELNCLALIHLFLHIDNCSSHVAGCRGFLTACETVSVYWLAISRCSQFRCGADWPTRAGWEVAAQLWGQAYHYSLQVCQY